MINIFIIFLFFVIVSSVIYFYFLWKSFYDIEERLNNQVKSDIDYLYNYLKNIEEKPYPKWTVVYIKNWEQVHEWDDWDIVIGNTCFLWLGERVIDKRFWRCYAYAVSKDNKDFEVGWIIKNKWYEIYRRWTKEILLNLYENLPYPPIKNNKIILYLSWWKPFFSCNYYKEKFYYLDSKCKVEIKWDFNWYFILPDWSKIYIIPKDWYFSIDFDYEFNWITKASIIQNVWIAVYNLFRFNDWNFEVKDRNWNVLVIRWTKFTLEIWDNFYLYLVKWLLNLNKINLDKKLIWIENNIKLDLLKEKASKVSDLLNAYVYINFLFKTWVTSEFEKKENLNIKIDLVDWISYEEKYKDFSIITFSWTIPERPDLKPTLFWKNLNEILDVCYNVWKKSVTIHDFYKFIKSWNLDSYDLVFNIKEDQIIYIKHDFEKSSDLNIIYYDPLLKKIVRWPISFNRWKENKKINKISVLCIN